MRADSPNAIAEHAIGLLLTSADGGAQAPHGRASHLRVGLLASRPDGVRLGGREGGHRRHGQDRAQVPRILWGFDCRVIAVDPAPSAEPAGLVPVNSCRGVVDTRALIAAHKSKHQGGPSTRRCAYRTRGGGDPTQELPPKWCFRTRRVDSEVGGVASCRSTSSATHHPPPMKLGRSSVTTSQREPRYRLLGWTGVLRASVLAIDTRSLLAEPSTNASARVRTRASLEGGTRVIATCSVLVLEAPPGIRGHNLSHRVGRGRRSRPER